MRISFSRGRGKIRHNNRDFISPNVDPSRVQNNIVLVRQDVREAYKEIFEEAQEKYNQKQKRENRKINDYYTSLFGENSGDTIVKNDNKQSNFYEWVVGVGDMNTTGYAANLELAKVAEKCLQLYFNGDEKLGIKSFAERNPQLKVFNAVIHCDEATPHLHFDAFPFAEGYKTGTSRQTAITKSLEQMGYGKGAETIKNFTQSERNVLREISESFGLDIDEEQTGRGQTLSVREYKKAADKMYTELEEKFASIHDEMQAQINNLDAQVAEKEQQLEQLNRQLDFAGRDFWTAEEVKRQNQFTDMVHSWRKESDENERKYDKSEFSDR